MAGMYVLAVSGGPGGNVRYVSASHIHRRDKQNLWFKENDTGSLLFALDN
jgi:hypothetical protein